MHVYIDICIRVKYSSHECGYVGVDNPLELWSKYIPATLQAQPLTTTHLEQKERALIGRPHPPMEYGLESDAK